ncbi:MAG: hypothetical protein R3336_01825 [Phycisphaeraceae bacterium]|nr:hypothetical protein [Phycisphaeraceae bacterium]
MVVTLLAIILLAGLVMYVVNLGQQVNGRVQTQHAADVAVTGGAGWVARSMNTVAMNNVTTANLISTVAVLDALPRAFDDALTDQEMLQEAIEDQLDRGVSDAWVEEALRSMLDEVNDSIDQLEEMTDFFDRVDVREMTFYEGPSGRGQIWKAMQGLEDHSLAAMENLGVLAQLNAVAGGEANLTGRNAHAFLVPVTPEIPWESRPFDDFERPVRQGLLREEIDDTTHRRGPYDAMYGWRQLVGGEREGYWETGDVASGGSGSVPIGGGVNRGRFVTTERSDPEGYRVYGPWQSLRGMVGSWASRVVPYSRLGRRVNQLSRWKLHNVWPEEREPPSNSIPPEWETDFNDATAIADSGTPTIRQTAFIAVEIKSRYPVSSPQFLTPGSWTYDGSSPRVIYTRGWEDPRTWLATKTDAHIWRDEWEYEVFRDSTIGIEQLYNDDSEPVTQTVYRIDSFMFAGINTGSPELIRNPFNFGSREELPGPVDLVHDQLEHDDFTARRKHLDFLAVAQSSPRSLLWPSRFASRAPNPNTVAIAQATVFNDHSWDLWTQTWHAQLEPVDSLTDWTQRMANDSSGPDAIPAVDAATYDELLVYLQSLETLAPTNLVH